MRKQEYNVENSLGFLTISANRLMSALARKRLVEAGMDITIEQWGILALLWNKEGLSQDELAQIVCVDKSSISRVLDGLERRGLVARRRDPEDARRKILYATPESWRIREDCYKIADKATRDMLHKVDDKDLEICLKVLAQVKEAIRAMT